MKERRLLGLEDPEPEDNEFEFKETRGRPMGS